MKKLTAILSALVLILSVTPAAFATVYSEGYFKYTIADESITITDYFGSEETVTVPAMIAGIPVNTIASGAFSGSGIKELNLPDTITSIENGAIDAGVVINYNSNLPSGGQTQPDPPQPDTPQTDPTQSYYPQPPLPGLIANPIPPVTQTQTEDGEEDIVVSEETVPDDITVSEATTDDKAQSEQPKQTQTQATKPAKSDETKPKQSQTNQPQPSQESAATTTQNAIEEVEIELDIQSTEAVTTVADETTDSTEETEAAPAAASEPDKDDSHKPAGAVAVSAVAAAVIAVIAVVGVILWKKKK